MRGRVPKDRYTYNKKRFRTEKEATWVTKGR